MKCKRFLAGILIIGVLIFSFSGCNQKSETVDLNNIQLTEAQIEDVSNNINDDLTETKFSGTVYAGLNNQDIFLNSYGYTDRKKTKKLDDDYVYQIGSVSKIFTGLAVMKLNNEGKLDLTDTLDKYFPEYDNKEYKKIKIENLLDMTSGFDSYNTHRPNRSAFLKKIVKMVHKNPDNPQISNEILNFILSKGTAKPVGNYCYSNSGYYLLGNIIEQAANESYFDYVEKNIIKPLGLKETSFLTNKSTKRGYNEKLKKWIDQEDYSILNNPYVMYSSMGIQSSAEDLAKLCDGILCNKIIENTDCIGKIKKTSSKYNYGFYINGNTIYSNGATSLHSGFVYINTEYLEKIVLLSNHTGIKDFDETTKNVYNKLNSKINGIIINQIEN